MSLLKKLSLFSATILLISCSGLPKLSLTPVDADVTVGGQHETQSSEESMVKVQTGDSSQTEYNADAVTQTYQNIQEYPAWLILAFACAVGLAVPSPFSAWSSWQQRRRLESMIDKLLASPSTSTTRPEENPSSDSLP
jgi:hypothetical protein